MPVWWGKKSSKLKQQNPPELSRKVDFAAPASRSDHRRLSPAVDEKLKSFDAAGLLNPGNSPRSSREFGVIEGSSSGFSGFESDGTPWPLPRPSISSTQSLGNDLRVHVSGSASVSSVSSSESSDDHPLLQDHAQLGVYRANSENKVNSRPKSPGPARGNTPTMSPRHSQLSCSTLDSPTGKQEDGKALSHPLPLPPGSPSSPPAALTYPRTSGVPESVSHVISKWKKGRLLGRGTFGHVYLGFNSESGHLCAIKEVKVLSDDQLSKECLRQLNQEISLLNQLSHPNIVQYYGSELGEESLTVFLEYVSGGSIQRLLQEYGPFKEPVIQNYTRKILSGLAYLHGRNTVHRDIKGANILVDPNGEIKLADFGMAKHITACSSMLSFKGSPYWMAPEVVMNTNGYSLPVDIWSLGCTILEMAMAKPPWSQFEGVAAIFKIGNSKDLPEIPDHFSGDAKSFVKQCLQRDPTMRPTAFELLDHPFVRDQTGTGGVANGNMTRGTVPFTYDGGRTQPILEPQSHRANITPIDRDYLTLPAASRAMKSQRECVRTFASMPVSPCSSPLRQNAAARRSCFLSPPHPAYPVMVPQRSHDGNGYLTFPVRASLDLLPESSFNRSMSPTRSPRIR